MEEKKRLAVFFPGIGYTCDKPLLYYGEKLAKQLGYETMRVPYTGFPKKVIGDADKMRESFEIALSQTREICKDINWQDYGQIVFFGKSVGTAVCGAYAEEVGLQTKPETAKGAADRHFDFRFVLFTPVELTFPFIYEEAIAFHGTADPWAKTEHIITACKEKHIPLTITENANHSLETGDLETDLATIKRSMDIVKTWLTK